MDIKERTETVYRKCSGEQRKFPRKFWCLFTGCKIYFMKERHNDRKYFIVNLHIHVTTKWCSDE